MRVDLPAKKPRVLPCLGLAAVLLAAASPAARARSSAPAAHAVDSLTAGIRAGPTNGLARQDGPRSR